MSQISEDAKVEMTFDEWLKYGMENSFCGPPVCVTHDGEPSTAMPKY